MFERFGDKLGLSFLLSIVALIVVLIVIWVIRNFGWKVPLAIIGLNSIMYIIVDKFDLINK